MTAKEAKAKLAEAKKLLQRIADREFCPEDFQDQYDFRDDVEDIRKFLNKEAE